jgi:hypothetical protein
MAEYALDSEAGKKWMPWFRDIFEQGMDVPPERAARLVNLLASGRADVLSGRFLTVHDDVPGLVVRVQSGRGDDFGRLRLQQI